LPTECCFGILVLFSYIHHFIDFPFPRFRAALILRAKALAGGFTFAKKFLVLLASQDATLRVVRVNQQNPKLARRNRVLKKIKKNMQIFASIKKRCIFAF